ncbi:alpha-ketoglutarate-dependent dioxygenase AlkB [Flavobacteriaceae bacterium F89]|uniref:Alpha-ketoglutarate-dependent dioxygenase AlkB n=1 Tax=Cerina litoralis TaxID=2874477 RepID=A0AAE3EU97_9FLAO|nr:alpha-ketoglutarate-dependent dioxygenase AlkB [Cerina litoralis]MCG2461202.1 alpha-ketoglutarate-dependent dioxygenase AlkB [Cerina litoralis]
MDNRDTDYLDLNLPDSEIYYYPHFLNTDEADRYFDILRTTAPWQQDFITIYGKKHPQPRLTALFGDKPYSYSGLTMHPEPFNSELLDIKAKIEGATQLEFNTCLLNLYRNGKDSNGWHADDETELGKNPAIASLSLGQERIFHLKHRYDKTLKHKILLEHGSLLLMQGSTQHHWLHQIPKTAKPIKERINLTFRVIR